MGSRWRDYGDEGWDTSNVSKATIEIYISDKIKTIIEGGEEVRTTEAREIFEKALKEIAKIRFDDGWDDNEVKPVQVSICNKTECDAGNNCCHRFFIQKIAFCVS